MPILDFLFINAPSRVSVANPLIEDVIFPFSSDNEVGLKNLRERSLKLCQKHPLYS